MSMLVINKVGQPTNPPTNAAALYLDTVDGRAKILDSTGRLDVIPDNSRYNFLVNGGFDFVQRWPAALTTNTQTASGRTINPDRWGLTAQTASCQYARVDSSATIVSNLSARYYGQFKQITGAGKICITQVVENKDAMAMRGRQVRLQFKIRFGTNASLTNYRFGILQLTSAGTLDAMPGTFISAFGANSTDPTFGTNLVALTPSLPTGGTVVGSFVTVTPTNAFLLVSAVFTIPTNCLNLVAVVFSDSQLSVNDDLHLGEAGLLIGQEINDWYPLSHSEELERAVRFCWKTFAIDTAPAQNVGAGTGEFRFQAGKAAAAAEFGYVQFPSRMRATPTTVTLYNPAAANAQVRDFTVPGDCSASASANASDTGLVINATGNATTAVGNPLGVHLLVDAEI